MLRAQVLPGSRPSGEAVPVSSAEKASRKNDPIVGQLYTDGPSLIAHKLYAEPDPEAIQKLSGTGDAETLF